MSITNFFNDNKEGMGFEMSNNEDIKIKKTNEMRTKGISKMISEGGLGADKYYNIVKEPASEEKEDSDETDKKQTKPTE